MKYDAPLKILTDGLCYGRVWFTSLDFLKHNVCKTLNDYWSFDGSIFDELTNEDLNAIKTQKKLIIDCSWNSFSIEKIYNILHKDCIKFNVEERNVILLTGNLNRESLTYNNWFATKNYKNKIQTFAFPVFIQMAQNIAKDILVSKVEFNKFVTFSRFPRYHRNVMNYKLILEKLPVDLSQCSVEDEILKEECKRLDVDFTKKDVFKFKKIIDRDDFDTPTPINWTESQSNFLSKYKFILVQDTNIEDFGFYITEKVWKSMLYERPLIIWGQPGVNHYIEEMGFRLYDKFFDLSFDYEKNDAKRLDLLVKELKNASFKIKDANWLDNDKETLTYNKQFLLSNRCLKKWINPLKTI